MSTVLMAYGTIEGPVEVKSVGNPAKKLATFGLNDGTGPAYQVEAWKETADSLPPIGTFVVIQGRLSSRAFTKKDGTPGKSLSVTASRIEPVPLPGRVAPVAAQGQHLAPPAPLAATDGFGD